MLTRIRNAAMAKHPRVDLPSSKLKVEVARILKDEGYLANYKVVDEKGKKTLRLFMRYTPDRRCVITDLKRISRPGSRPTSRPQMYHCFRISDGIASAGSILYFS